MELLALAWLTFAILLAPFAYAPRQYRYQKCFLWTTPRVGIYCMYRIRILWSSMTMTLDKLGRSEFICWVAPHAQAQVHNMGLV